MQQSASGSAFALALAVSLIVLAGIPPARGDAARDVVFACPCDAVWTSIGTDGSGQLTLNFGVRSFRATASGEVRLSYAHALDAPGDFGRVLSWRRHYPSEWPPLGSVPPGSRLTDQSRTFNVRRPEPGEPILILLYERAARLPPATNDANPFHAWHRHEALALWPVPEDPSSERLRFVDILTDTDGDGTANVNERIVGTSVHDPAEAPGVSTVDVLALYDAPVYQLFDGDPHTRIHHLLTLAGAIFADSGTGMRLRGVGMKQVEWNERGLVDDYDALMDAHGADLILQFHAGFGPGSPCGFDSAGCAAVGGLRVRGLWAPQWAATSVSAGATTAAHELGHVLGLVHAARQGEAYGAFRWSRGYFMAGASGHHRPQGTIMAYGGEQTFGDRFSSARIRCRGQPCGVPVDEPDGTDAVATLQLLRFQAEAVREPMPDTDGDGIVDAVDAAPHDPHEWSDIDGDGIGGFADTDDDNDGVTDGEDAFPLDPDEWADVDGDGIGDNADREVLDLSPFTDPALRAVVEEALEKQPGAPITQADLAMLEELHAARKGIRNLAGLELATNLRYADLQLNRISDLSPLSGLSRLNVLFLGYNGIRDPSPLGNLSGLRELSLDHNDPFDPVPLAELTSLETLYLDHSGIADLSPLASLRGLVRLSIAANDFTDLSPLTELTRLRHLNISDNDVADLSPLSRLPLVSLQIGHSNAVLENVLDLGNLRRVATLDLTGLGIGDVAALSERIEPRELILRDNAIVDVQPLRELTGIEVLDLSSNDIEDIGPLVKRAIWRGVHAIEDAHLRLQGNPLDRRSLETHVPTLRSWGLNIQLERLPDDTAPVDFADPGLRALVAQAVARGSVYVDDAVTEGTMATLETLRAGGVGLSDLAGLEAAEQLQYLYLGSNDVQDLSPLADLPNLTGIDLGDNRIVDLAPLAANPHLADGDWIVLDRNPLSETSVNTHIPALLERGVEVSFAGVTLVATAGGETVRFDSAGYFDSVLDGDLRMSARAGNRALAYAEVDKGRLTVTPGASGGRTAVTVTATNTDGESAEVSFELTLTGAVAVSTFPSASDPVRQGFVRAINRTGIRQPLRIDAFDASGQRRGPVRLRIGAGRAAQFNSDDLEAGNASKGLSGSIGQGTGDWRLAVDGTRDSDLFSYIRTEDGFLTAMHDLAPLTAEGHRIAIFNPGDNPNQVSLLRLLNPGGGAAEVTVTGVDDMGASPGGPVTLTLGPRTAQTLSALELESGDGLNGALGDGIGKWRLTIAADGPILAASLLRSPTGHLTNLSTVPDNRVARGGETVHRVPLFLSASDPAQRQGFVRVINRSAEEATVRIQALDNSPAERDPVTLTVAANSVVHINSSDLELGNARKGLSGGTGAGAGDWRLEFASEADIDVLAYIRTQDGFLTSVHDTVPLRSEGYMLPLFNPGDNPNQLSRLYLANDSNNWATVKLWGTDDAGTPGGNVLLWVAPGESRTLSALELERGGGVRRGKLGDGTGKWRLRVTSDVPIDVMSLLESPTGHLTNLSTGPH